MLGLVAGDAAGGAWKLGYSAVTAQVTLISYQLIEHRALDPRRLVAVMRDMDGADGQESVFRAETETFRGWLDRTSPDAWVPSQEASLDNVARTPPLGAAFRRDANEVVGESIALGRLFSLDATSVTLGVLGASAVAAAAFGQSGRDFVTGVSEAVIGAVAGLGDVSGRERLDTLEREMSDCVEHVGATSGTAALEAIGGSADDPLSLGLAGLVLAGAVSERPHTAVEEAAKLGGSVLGAFVGAVVGSRAGIRAWPWPFANDTWFAEIGRRVVRGPDEIRDLPIPQAVEHHLMSGEDPGFH